MWIKSLLIRNLPIHLLLFSLAFFYLSIPLFAQQGELPYILVSVAPHKYFVEKIAGDTLKVGLIVPAGASAHTYEPSPKQMLRASTASIWFRIGEIFETKAIRAIQDHQPNLKVIDLRQGLDLIGGAEECGHSHCHCNAMDLHFWLSPRLGQIQAETIAKTLIDTYPEHAELYKTRLKIFQQELQKLDEKIKSILTTIPNRHILVSHPAYAYFCRDYDLKQFSIECEGKDPSPQQLTQLLRDARQYKIKTIFIQSQYSNKGARLVAEAIGARVMNLDPYAENVPTSLLEIAQAFAEG